MSIEHVILNHLVFNEQYGRKAIPFLRPEYFQGHSDRLIFNTIDLYVQKYNSFPSLDALGIELSNKSGIGEEEFKNAINTITSFKKDDTTKLEWLVDQTEKFCQERAIYNAIMNSIQIINGDDQKNDKGAIPQILSEALAVSFDTHIGHDFLEQFESRYEFYHQKEVRIPFDIENMNKITGGGLPRKTLNIVLAGTGVGKSLFMCHCAAANLARGLNVLYITMEMAEEKIAERIDANLLDVPMDQLRSMPHDIYAKKINRLQSKTKGKLVIKEYPTACAGAAHFRHLLNELRLKKNFVPDIIYIDYLNICTSSRMKYGAGTNSYTFIKAIAEELRGLAVEFDVPIISATQTTRGGFANSDVDLTDTSESFGLPATADFMFAIMATEELEELGQLLFKQLKNRYNDPGYMKRFVVGVDRSKMKLYDVEQSAQDDLVNDRPVMDGGKFMEEDNERGKKSFDRSRFRGVK